MAVQYCTATNYGKDFFTHAERSKMSLIGYPGNVWVVDGGSNGDAWITKVSGVAKSKADAQTIVDAAITISQEEWDTKQLTRDSMTDAEKADFDKLNGPRPEAVALPGLG